MNERFPTDRFSANPFWRIPVQDSDDASVKAMVGHFEGAIVAMVTDAVYLADHAFSAKLIVGAFLDDADEFVAEDPAKAHIPLDDFEVGVADARAQHADQRLAGSGPRDGPQDEARLFIED